MENFMMKRTLRRYGLLICAVLTLSAGADINCHGQGVARGKYYTKAEVDRIIKRVEERSDEFRKVVDKSLDRGALDGTRREDNINEQVKQLENAIDELRSEFDRRDSWQDTRSNVQKVLDEADEVNALVRRNWRRLNGAVRSEWVLVRADLNRLAGVYNLRLLR
jgi:hypothetical protein